MWHKFKILKLKSYSSYSMLSFLPDQKGISQEVLCTFFRWTPHKDTQPTPVKRHSKYQHTSIGIPLGSTCCALVHFNGLHASRYLNHKSHRTNSPILTSIDVILLTWHWEQCWAEHTKLLPILEVQWVLFYPLFLPPKSRNVMRQPYGARVSVTSLGCKLNWV